jgi:hypothetical protein
MEILEPLSDATELLSGSKYPTQGDLRVIIFGLIQHLEMQSDSSINSQAIVAKKIKQKLEDYWPILRDSSVLGTLLDPRTKLSAFEQSDHQLAHLALQACFDSYAPEADETSERKPVSKRDFFKNLMMKGHTTPTSSCSTEIDRYLTLPNEADDNDPLVWWQLNAERFPTLANAARDYLGIQSTSVASEATFSVARHTVSSVRNRIDGESARASLCLKSWLTNLHLNTDE